MSFGGVFWSCWGSVGPTAKQLFWQCFAKTFFVLIAFRKVRFGRVLPKFCNSECPYCVPDSTSCMMLYCLLYLCPPTCCFSICLFVCLFVLVSQHHMSPALFVYFPFQIVSVVDRQQANAKSDCTHCIRRGHSRRLRSSLLLNSSPRCDPPCRIPYLMF